MATLQEYMNRRNAMSSSYDKYLQGTPRAKTKSFWQEEDVATALYRQRREMEERREASRRELEEQIRRAQQNSITPVKQGSDAGFLEKTGETVLDVFGNILSGASKALEGVFDLGISGIGAIGGVFDKGFRDEMRRWVEYDVTGQHVQANFDKWSDDSVLNNSKFGQVTENVLQGVGQMLPTVLLSVATGGAAAPIMLGASAAGNATEEAWNEGADYYRGLGYGLLTGGIEAGIEMATGGVAGLGVGYLDNILPSLASKTAATGVRRVLGNMAGEAAEEAVSALVNPLAKTIYKGRDALDDYSKAEYWQGVGESALVGGLTSAVYGGTVGRAMKASGKYGDVKETVDDIKATEAKRQNLHINDKLTDAREEALHRRTVANYRQIEKILQSATPKQRATMIKQNGLDGAFDADGSLTADFLRSLGENVVDGQTDAQGENAQGEGISAAESVQFRFKDGQESKSQDLVDFYQSVLSMKDNAAKNKRKKKIGVVTQEHATLVSDLIKKETGKTIDLSDYEIWINGSAVNHIEDRHGKNGAADKSMADMDNVARIPWALDNATSGEVLKKDDGNLDLDYNYKNSDGSPSVKVRISKEVDNGLLFVAECVPDTNEKKLHILSAYMQQKSSEGQELTHKTQSPPQPTSETVLDSNTATNSIPQNPDLSTASGEKSSGTFDHRFMSPDLWRREGEVRREIAKISEDSGEDISVLARDFSDEGKKHHKKLKQAFATLSEVSGGRLQMVVVEKNSTFTGAYAHGDTVYISADAIESGKWGEALIEESTHFTQGTAEHGLLRAFLADDAELLAKIESELTKAGNDYGFTAEDAAAFRAYLDGDADTELTGRALRYSNELTAHMSAELLSNEAVIDRLVGQHATLAEKILIKFKQLGRAFAKDKALAKRVADAEQIYLAAIERRGWKYENGKIVQSGEDEEESTIDYSRMNDKSFAQNVNEILNMSDEDAKRNAEEGNFVQVMPNTPALVREYVKNAEDLPIIIRFDALYLASRHDGALQGHYHNLGADIMPKLPDIIAHPDAIVKMKNGRVNLYSQFTTAKGKNGIISVELNTVKDINSKYSKYNLVVTVLPAKDTYAQNNLMNNAVAVAYEKEDLSQVNPQLHKWLAIVNDKSSTTIITENSDLSTPKTDFRAKEQTSDDSRELSLADLRAMDERDAKRENRFVKGSLSEVSDTLAKSADLKRGHKTELLTKLNDLYEYMAGSEVDGEVVATEIERIAVWMAEQRVQVEIEREAGYAQMLDMLKEARVTLTEAQRLAAANEHGSFSKYRNRVWGKIKLVSDGMPLATLWREWNEKYPSVFAEDVAEDLMPEELLHVIERADESRSDKYLAEMEMRETDEEMILRMYEEIYEGFFNVRQKATPEERYNAALFKEKEAHREERDALRRENRELSEQHERDERVMARLTARKNAMEQDARESRRMTAEAAKAATAERHEREQAESKLETARKRNERLKARNEAVEQDARESRRKAAEAAKKTAEAKTKHKIIARLTHDNGPLHKLYELRKGRFFSAQIYQSDILQGIPTKMASIKESALISGSARTVISEVRDWYCDVENTMLYRKAGSEDADGQQTGTVEYDPTIAEFLESIANGEGEFTLDELRALESIAGHFVTIAQKYRSVLKDGKYVDGEPIARKYVSKISDAKKNETGFVRLMRSKYLRQFGDPLSLVKSFDAYDAEGYFTETYRELREAAVNMAVREMDILMGYRQFHDKHKKWAKRMINDAVHFRGNNIPLGHAISLYMTAKREQSMRGLVESGFAYNNTKGERVRLPGFDPELEATLKDDLNAKDIKLTKEQFAEEYRARIEARCKTVERELWASFDEDTRTYVKLIEASFDGDCRRIKIDTDKAQQGYSTVSEDGYYYPSVRAQVAKELHAGRYEGDRVSHLSLNKETVEGARGELLIEAVDKVYLRHVRNLCLYADMSAFIENQNVLRNLDVSGNVRKAVTIKSEIEASGKQYTEMQRFMDKLIKDIQKIPGEASDEQSLWKETVEFLRGSYAKFQLGANPKVLVTQFSSLFAASSRLDYSCLLSGLGTASGDVDKYCRLAELRNSENTAALASGVLTEMTNKIGDKLMMGIGKIDRLVVTRLFGACQQQIAKDKGLKVGSEENKIEAGKLLAEVILDTQQNSLATERSDAMRSSDTLLRSLTMFSADAMKVFGRFADGWGRSLTLSKQLKNTTDAKARVAIEAELKEARREFRRAAGALVASSVFMALIAQLFRDLYAKDDDKELDERVADITIDALGNMVGGLPILRDVASYLTDGYEVDNFMLSTFNDVLVASTDVLGLAGDALGGKDISSQDVAKTTRKAVYAVGQVFGIPIRNSYNLVTGLSSRFSKKAKYWNENLFYKQSYTKDLQAAIEADDERMIALIASMMMDERVGDVDKSLSDGLRPLVEGGYDVLPRALGDSIVYDGEEVVLTKRQKKRFKEVYGIAEEVIASMMKLSQYKEATDEVRARAIKLIWEAYYDLAVDDVLGVDSSEKNVLFAEAIDMDKLALIVATARGIKADVGANGKAINGSRLAKIEAYIEGLKLKAAQKHMLLGYLGYRNGNGEDKVRAYINTLSALSKEEKRLLLEFSGYDAA